MQQPNIFFFCITITNNFIKSSTRGRQKGNVKLVFMSIWQSLSSLDPLEFTQGDVEYIGII